MDSQPPPFVRPQPPFVFEGQPDRRQITAAVRHVSRRRLWIVRLVGVAIALVGIAMLFADEGIGAGLTYAALGVGWIIAMPLIALRKATGASMKIIGHPTAYRVDSDGVHQNSQIAATTFRWPLITGIEELPEQLLVRVGKVQFLPLPTASLPEPTREAMVGFLRGRLGGPSTQLLERETLRPPTP
jgi:hypothetical protein